MHREKYGTMPHPLLGVGVCNCDFDGPDFLEGQYKNCDYTNLHNMRRGDVVVQILDNKYPDCTLSFGSVIHCEGGVTSRKWYHPTVVSRMRNWHYSTVRDLENALKEHWLLMKAKAP